MFRLRVILGGEYSKAALSASTRPGPFQEFYAALLAKREETGDGASHPGTEDRIDHP